MRYAILTLTFATLLTGCVGAAPTDSQAGIAPSGPCDNTNHAFGTVALVVTAPAQLVRGTSAALVATAINSDGTRIDATNTVTWSSTDLLTAAVTAAKLYGIGAGTATIRASIGEVTATTDIEILPLTLQALTIDADAESAPSGAVIGWRVNGHYNDASIADLTSSANWQTSDASIATIDGPGQIHAVATGMAMITIAANGVEISAPMQVTQ